jgi:hypothetical protein
MAICGVPLGTNTGMALHRDIYWVGRQWSVTGHGIQAIDPKLEGKFDIEVSRLWDDGLPESMHAQKWLNIGDFDKALAVARGHYPQPRRNAAAASVALPAPPDSATRKDPPKPNPGPIPASFAMRAEGCRARFLRPWRVRLRWQR